jgi:hypothetical protein
MTNTNRPSGSGRPDAAAYWLSEASYRLQRYMQRPAADTLEPLMRVLADYRLAVQAGQVDPPNFPSLNARP